jgi:hypothetical protein
MRKNSNDEGRTEHKIGDETIHVKINKKKLDEEFIFEVVGQGGRDYEGVINDRLKKHGNAKPDATTAGSSADAPDATFLHKNKEHPLEIKKDKGAMFGQIELHHNGKSWDVSERSKNKYPETHKQIQKSGFLKKLNTQWKKPSGDYEKDLKMGNVYHNHPNADPIKAHYGKDRKTNYIQIGGGHGFYHTGNDVAKLNSPELHGQTQIRARMKPRGYDKNGKRTYGALAVMSLKGDINKSHHDLDKDPKKVNEDFESFLKESVTVSITGDTPQEVQSMLSSFSHGQTTEKVEEAEEELVNYMSDTSESLTLGKTMEIIGQRNDGYVITNADIQAMFEEQKVKLLRDNNGKLKIFLLRRSAAKESHIHGGEVMKHPNGYVIKIKEENDNVNEITQLTEAQTKGSRSGARSSSTKTSSSTRGDFITESYNYTQESTSEKSSTKITLAEIRKRKQAQVSESIDMGIEPGISMAASGENLRSTVRKKRIEELTGDETTLSNSAEVEGELKRKGINLKSFKASRYGSF